MIRRQIKLFSILFVIGVNAAFAQQEHSHLFDKFGRYYFTPSFMPLSWYTQFTREPYFTRLPDTLYIQVESIADIRQIVDAKLQDHIYGISINRVDDSKNLDTIVSALTKFPKLFYLKIDNSYTYHSTEKKAAYQLPEAVKQLQQLQGIEFSGTNSIDMPDAIKKMAALKKLEILSFFLYDRPLPKTLTDLTNIHIIQLSSLNLQNIDATRANWQIVSLQRGSQDAKVNEAALLKLSQDRSLQRLYLGDRLSFSNENTFKLIDADGLSKFDSLKALSIFSVKTSGDAQLFKKIGYLKNLEYLYINIGNDTTQYVDGIENLKNLHHLDISFPNSLKSHPGQLQKIAALINLNELILQGYRITNMPDIFAGLKQLKTLSISLATIDKLPESIFDLPELENLDLPGNHLTALPNKQTYNCIHLKKLNIGGNSIVALPPAITSLTQLEYFNAENNHIKNIPVTGWQNLRQLKEINLGQNQISIFPGGLEQVNSLEKIDLSDNDISTFPDPGIGTYKLKELLLTNNNLVALPEHIGRYSELEYLFADENLLKALPESLGDCEKLKYLNINTNWDRGMVPKPPANMSPKHTVDGNRVKALPEGLKNAKNLEILDLAGNIGIDETSVFNVILSVPRRSFRVNLSGTGITTIPASSQWANMEFDQLDLSKNNISSLPVQFAAIKKFNSINVDDNPIRETPASWHSIKNKADIKVLFDEAGIALPGFEVPNNEYVISLTNRITDFYRKKQWAKGLEDAQKAMAVDSATYMENVHLNDVGICRFKLNDFTGAINDFDNFENYIDKETKANANWHYITADTVEKYKADAWIALGQPKKAAETHEDFWKKFDKIGSVLQATMLYKQIGMELKARQLVDTALQRYKPNLKNPPTPMYYQSGILEYAGVLVILSKPAEALKLINDQKASFEKDFMPSKDYLLATAGYLSDPGSFPQIKKTLAGQIAVDGKINDFNYSMSFMLYRWLDQSGYTAVVKDQLLALQNIAR